jgi:hypothetical protein
MLIKSGRRYKITNAEAGFVVDLSGFDNRSIIGWHDHGKDNQKVRAACFFNIRTNPFTKVTRFSGS